MIKINILIIAYSQQELIKRALDSILLQKEYGLNKIIVCDDCSPDNTWLVLKEYQNSYSDILEIHQNPKNLGIYGNWNQMILNKGDADVYYCMAGDDALCDGILEQVQKKVSKEKIDCSQPVALYFDWKSVRPDGKETIHSNSAVKKNKDIFGKKLRNRISGRSCFVTNGLMKNYQLVDLSLGTALAETLADMQYSILAKFNYYEEFAGSIYYSGIGISQKIHTKEYYEHSIKACEQIINIYQLTGRNKLWELYRINYYKLAMSPSLSCAFKTLWYYLLGVKYGPLMKNVNEVLEIVGFLKGMI